MSVYKAISEIQANPPALLKDGRGQYGAYLTLGNLFAALLPLLAEKGVAVTQAPTVFEGQPALRTQLYHWESDTAVEDIMLLMSESLSPQKQGGAITYARRYALCSMVGVVADEDDDGQAAQNAAVPARQPKRIVNRKVVEPDDTGSAWEPRPPANGNPF